MVNGENIILFLSVGDPFYGKTFNNILFHQMFMEDLFKVLYQIHIIKNS
jgi:hypothetical protein